MMILRKGLSVCYFFKYRPWASFLHVFFLVLSRWMWVAERAFANTPSRSRQDVAVRFWSGETFLRCSTCSGCRPVPSGCPVSPVAVAAAVCCCRCCCCYRLRCRLGLCCRLRCQHLRVHILHMLYSTHRSRVRAHPLSKPID